MSPSSRRHILGYGLLLSAAAFGRAAQGVHAGRGWCRSDPLVLIDGNLADIFCTAPLTAFMQVTGPTEIAITVPEGVNGKLVLAGIGFGRGEKVRFGTSKELTRTEEHIDVKVEVMVPARVDMPIGVEFAPRLIGILNPARADGFANSVITLTTKIADGGIGVLSLNRESTRRERNARGRAKTRHSRRRPR